MKNKRFSVILAFFLVLAMVFSLVANAAQNDEHNDDSNYVEEHYDSEEEVLAEDDNEEDANENEEEVLVEDDNEELTHNDYIVGTITIDYRTNARGIKTEVITSDLPSSISFEFLGDGTAFEPLSNNNLNPGDGGGCCSNPRLVLVVDHAVGSTTQLCTNCGHSIFYKP